MANFLEGTQLNLAIEDLFKTAEDYVVIISPFVKIHPRIKDALLSHRDNHKFQLVIVFGKNETDLSKSISQEDLNFFKQFTDVEIRHQPRLHAKYYSNEKISILSSMNLYDFSQNNNIEFGILTDQESEVSGKLDYDAHNYFNQVVDNSRLLYKKVAEFDSKMLGLKQTYKGSIVEIDIIEEQFKKVSNTSDKKSSDKQGYCIRTGVKIPFNMKMPMSVKSYESWSKYKDENYQEKFCHFTGKESKGQTSFNRPVLKKNWKEAINN